MVLLERENASLKVEMAEKERLHELDFEVFKMLISKLKDKCIDTQEVLETADLTDIGDELGGIENLLDSICFCNGSVHVSSFLPSQVCFAKSSLFRKLNLVVCLQLMSGADELRHEVMAYKVEAELVEREAVLARKDAEREALEARVVQLEIHEIARNKAAQKTEP